MGLPEGCLQVSKISKIDLIIEGEGYFTVWLEIGGLTYFINVHMSVKYGASRSSRLFSNHFVRRREDRTDGKTHSLLSMTANHGNAVKITTVEPALVIFLLLYPLNKKCQSKNPEHLHTGARCEENLMIY